MTSRVLLACRWLRWPWCCSTPNYKMCYQHRPSLDYDSFRLCRFCSTSVHQIIDCVTNIAFCWPGMHAPTLSWPESIQCCSCLSVCQTHNCIAHETFGKGYLSSTLVHQCHKLIVVVNVIHGLRRIKFASGCLLGLDGAST